MKVMCCVVRQLFSNYDGILSCNIIHLKPIGFALKLLIDECHIYFLIPQVLKTFLEKRNLTMQGSVTWISHQKCDDMFIYSKWNGTTSYGFGANERDFGTDYGICCW